MTMSTSTATTTTTQSTKSSDEVVDNTTPLLSSTENNDDGTNAQPSNRGTGTGTITLREATQLMQSASSRRMMREPSMLLRDPSVRVRQTAAEQLEERQSDWAYSKPVVVLDIVWNFAFVAVAVAVMVLSREEQPNMPLRLWIIGYGIQCVLHMLCVCVEYRRRWRRRNSRRYARSSSSSSLSSMEEGILQTERHVGEQLTANEQLEEGNGSGVAKHLESANTMFSFIWWIIGFYWVSAGGQDLARGSPQLYWLCIIFLGFDVFFVMFCVALACVIGIAVCCCLPCIIAILYAVTDQEGASKEDLDQLSKFKFRRVGDDEKVPGHAQGAVCGIMTECGTDSPIEHALMQEDVECCICLSSYEDGVELRELPCGHHFHCPCVDKWLFINATCPLCKYNILKSSNSHDTEEV